jgi:hypothetical protein
MKRINPRSVAMVLGGLLIATSAAGCFGGFGGDSSYSDHPYSYKTSYDAKGSYGGDYYPYNSRIGKCHLYLTGPLEAGEKRCVG